MSESRQRRTELRLLLLSLAFALPALGGCRQRMSQQPYFRPYEQSDFFYYTDPVDKQLKPQSASRPLERGVIHRSQHLESDPLVTGLTQEEWGRIYARGPEPKVDLAKPTPIEDRENAFGLPRYDQRDAGNPKVYVEQFPFEITADDLERGKERFTIYCAVCHGPLGNGQGKIWERGYLNPTSFHTKMVGEHEVDVSNKQAPGAPLGHSRGYALWGITIPMSEVPVGYYFEVISKGYGGMPMYSAQIPPADRWRIIAYVRALQLSQGEQPAGGKK
jgi:mono/diheme cytochrome c family protein